MRVCRAPAQPIQGKCLHLNAARIESLSIPKWRNAQRAGDDVVVALPDRFFAVFDGATDTTGTFKGPMSPGRFAASTAAGAMLAEVTRPGGPGTDPSHWLEAMNRAIQDGLVRMNAEQARVSTTMAMAMPLGEAMHLMVVGDSGIRINGRELLHITKDVDILFTQVRLGIRDQLQQQGLTGDLLENATRQWVFQGLDQKHGSAFAPAQVLAVIDRAVHACQDLLQADAIACIPTMVRQGIAGGQYPFANRAGHSLGYASLNGGMTVGRDMHHRVVPVHSVSSLELFTDGYVACPPDGITVSDWENHFARCEGQDPHKTGVYAGVKGSTEAYWSDDRSVLSVTFEAVCPSA